jgi:hypothetical protein
MDFIVLFFIQCCLEIYSCCYVHIQSMGLAAAQNYITFYLATALVHTLELSHTNKWEEFICPRSRLAIPGS